MITPELSQYVEEQVAAGYPISDIHTVLLANGWSKADADEALGMNQPQTNQQPAQIPVPQQAPARNVPKKSVVIISSIAALLVLGGGGYVAYTKIQNNTPGTAATITPSPSPAANTTDTSVFTDAGIQFSYDSSWRKAGSSAITSGDLAAVSTTPDMQHMFFTAANFQATQQELTNAKNNPTGEDAFSAFFTTLLSVSNKAEVSVTRAPNTSAKILAGQQTQSACTGKNVDFSTENPVDESRVISTTLNGIPAYTVASVPACDYKTFTVVIDGISTATTPTPSPEPGIIITSSQAAFPTDAFIIVFNQVTDLTSLNEGQKIILDSIKLL